MIWAPACKGLDREQLTAHKPTMQLSDGSDVNLLLTQTAFDADPHMKAGLPYL